MVHFIKFFFYLRFEGNFLGGQILTAELHPILEL